MDPISIPSMEGESVGAGPITRWMYRVATRYLVVPLRTLPRCPVELLTCRDAPLQQVLTIGGVGELGECSECS